MSNIGFTSDTATGRNLDRSITFSIQDDFFCIIHQMLPPRGRPEELTERQRESYDGQEIAIEHSLDAIETSCPL